MDRGDRGERGIEGRQGSQGVAGQQGREGPPGVDSAPGAAGATGLSGARGREGARGRTTRTAVILFVALMAFMSWTLWQGEHDSCVRQAAPRERVAAKITLDALRAERIAMHETGPERATNLYYAALYRRLVVAAPALHCGGLIPDVGSDDSTLSEQVLQEARRFP